MMLSASSMLYVLTRLTRQPELTSRASLLLAEKLASFVYYGHMDAHLTLIFTSESYMEWPVLGEVSSLLRARFSPEVILNRVQKGSHYIISNGFHLYVHPEWGEKLTELATSIERGQPTSQGEVEWVPFKETEIHVG